jgi:hypothetical protein
MLKSLRSLYILGFLLLSAPASVATAQTSTDQYVDPAVVRFGYEGTFQNKKMSDEDSPGTFKSDYKDKKARQFADAIVEAMGDTKHVFFERLYKTFKPFIQLDFPKESFLLTVEPGVIEVNESPKALSEIKRGWIPVYKAAEAIGLQASAYSLGHGGGGGHFHVGGRTFEENPFLTNPLLLRNLLVYTHQHPSLLFAFSEANDIGPESTMKTLHEAPLQADFRDMIEAFDDWYDGAPVADRRLEHNAFIKLAHIEKIMNGVRTNVKATVEWRNIRPLDSPDEVEAVAGLLMKQINRFSEPNFKVPFRFISDQEFLNFWGPSFTEYDWNLVKKDLGISDPRLDRLVHQYTQNEELKQKGYRKGKIQETYSDPEKSGLYREIVLPFSEGTARQSIRYKGGNFAANIIEIENKKYLSAVVPVGFVRLKCGDLFLNP